jgi:hypothetical protein
MQEYQKSDIVSICKLGTRINQNTNSLAAGQDSGIIFMHQACSGSQT